MKKITFIGDIHGNFKRYNQMVYKSEASIQIGDFGFAEDWFKLINARINSDEHKVLPGNHENYDYLNDTIIPHKMGDYGNINFHGLDFFYLRGALSIDQYMRTPGISWWEDEELSYQKLFDAVTLYEETKPDVVVTHMMPESILGEMFYSSPVIPSKTGQALSNMFEIHKPKLWIYGHMHPFRNIGKQILDTYFVCLREFGTIVVDPSKTINQNILELKKIVKKPM